MKNLTKPVNFRDLGGLRGKDGRRIRPFSILRSGELVKLSEEEQEILTKEYRLKTIADLRREEEYRVNPDDDIPGTVYHNIDVLKKIHKVGADLESLETVPDIHGAKFRMNSLYEQMVSNEGAQRGFREFLELLLKQKEGALLFHCFAGKDRTGLAAAIILTILGVDREDILADYLKTNELRREENTRLLENLKKQGISEEQRSSIEIALTVNAEFLETAYQTAEKQYGSFAGYINQALKVTKEEEEELQRRYLLER